MNLLPIANELVAQSLCIAGQTVFINFMPAQAGQGVLLRDYFGGTPIDSELPGYYRGSYMLIVRTQDQPAGELLMKQIVAALTVKVQRVLSGVTFKYMRPRALPFVYAPSPGQNIEIAVNMDCCFVDPAALAS